MRSYLEKVLSASEPWKDCSDVILLTMQAPTSGCPFLKQETDERVLAMESKSTPVQIRVIYKLCEFGPFT